MADSMPAPSPRTPAPRKAPKQSPAGSTMRKRRTKAEALDSPCTSKGKGSRTPRTQKATPKVKNQNASTSPYEHIAMSPYTPKSQIIDVFRSSQSTPCDRHEPVQPPHNTVNPQDCFTSPLVQSQPVNPDGPLIAFHKKWSKREMPQYPTPRLDGRDPVITDLFSVVVTTDTSLMPRNDTTVSGDQIDAIAYGMWNIAISSHCNRGDVLCYVAKYAAMLSDLKLRVLASLSILPSWWFLRERAVELIKNKWICPIDDSFMDLQWQVTVHYCNEVQKRRDAAMSGLGFGSPFPNV